MRLFRCTKIASPDPSASNKELADEQSSERQHWAADNASDAAARHGIAGIQLCAAQEALHGATLGSAPKCICEVSLNSIEAQEEAAARIIQYPVDSHCPVPCTRECGLQPSSEHGTSRRPVDAKTRYSQRSEIPEL